MSPESRSALDLVLAQFILLSDTETHRPLLFRAPSNIQILGHIRAPLYHYRLGLKADWPTRFC